MMCQTGECDRGSISLFFAILLIFFVAMAGVLGEGARRLGNISRAEDLASEAARAAAATLQVGALADGRAVIDVASQDGARRQAELILEAVPDDIIYVIDVSDSQQSVTVEVTVRESSWIPGFDIDGRGSHIAQVIDPLEIP